MRLNIKSLQLFPLWFFITCFVFNSAFAKGPTPIAFSSTLCGHDRITQSIQAIVKGNVSGGQIFAKEVHDPERFGQVKFDENMNAVKIEEKPKEKLSDFALTGLYIFDQRVVEAAKSLKPSARGELEITDLHNWYLQKGELKVDVVKGEWIDAGTFESLFKATELARKKANK